MEDDDRWDGVNAPDGLGFQHRWDGVLASAKDWMIVDSVQQAVFFFFLMGYTKGCLDPGGLCV